MIKDNVDNSIQFDQQQLNNVLYPEQGWTSIRLDDIHKARNPDSRTEPIGSGLIDIPPQKICSHPGHHAPSHICIPDGKAYRNVCPGCGQVTIIHSPAFRL